MVFSDKDFSHELQNSEIMQGQIKEAIKEVQPDVDNCFLDCLKGLNAVQLIQIIEKNYKNPDWSWKSRKEMRPTENTWHAYTTIVQCALKLLWYYSWEINAFYSSNVKAAVTLFQEQNCFSDNTHVKVDGVVWPNTFRLLVEKLWGIVPNAPTQEVANSPTEQWKNENNTWTVEPNQSTVEWKQSAVEPTQTVAEKIFTKEELVDKQWKVNKKNLSLFLKDELKYDMQNINNLITYLNFNTTEDASLSFTKWILGKHPIVDAIIYNRATEWLWTSNAVVDELINWSLKNPNHFIWLISDFKKYFNKDFIQILYEENKYSGKEKFYSYINKIAANNQLKNIVQDWLNNDTRTQRDLLTTIKSNTFKNKYPNIEKLTIENNTIASAE